MAKAHRKRVVVGDKDSFDLAFAYKGESDAAAAATASDEDDKGAPPELDADVSAFTRERALAAFSTDKLGCVTSTLRLLACRCRDKTRIMRACVSMMRSLAGCAQQPVCDGPAG
jgi:hypothetical protein